jgi:hypothetical protein
VILGLTEPLLQLGPLDVKAMDGRVHEAGCQGWFRDAREAFDVHDLSAEKPAEIAEGNRDSGTRTDNGPRPELPEQAKRENGA